MDKKADCCCTNAACPRHGDCEKCVEFHTLTTNEKIPACLRDKADAIYGKKYAAQ